jgi:hypothetical protein
VNCQRGLVQIALELKSRRLDELLVVGIVWYGRQFSGDIGAPHPAEVYINESIRSWQQTRRLGRGMFSQHDGQGNRSCNQQDGQDDGEASSYSHVSAARPAKGPCSMTPKCRGFCHDSTRGPCHRQTIECRTQTKAEIGKGTFPG